MSSCSQAAASTHAHFHISTMLQLHTQSKSLETSNSLPTSQVIYTRMHLQKYQ